MIGPCKNSQPTANICIKDNCFISEGVLEPHYMSNKLGSPPTTPGRREITNPPGAGVIITAH